MSKKIAFNENFSKIYANILNYIENLKKRINKFNRKKTVIRLNPKKIN